MKILLDTCVWGGVVQELRAAGHDVVWARDYRKTWAIRSKHSESPTERLSPVLLTLK
jgi:hypothetical protein